VDIALGLIDGVEVGCGDGFFVGFKLGLEVARIVG
jgi:hypothetical protein